ncbi:MAG: Protein of unknown function precursor [Bacteroidetes bacterium]|jgi:hypothetical protein|nr:Protein of unknown function precursor [Bacteroidota bacterium]
MKKKLLSIISFALLCGSVNNLNAQNASLYFDGGDDAVNLGNSINSILDPLNTITVEAWVNTSSFTGSGVIVGNYNSDFNNSQMQFLLRRELDQYSFWVDDGTGWKSVYTGFGAGVLNTWQHVAGTWDGSEIKIYVNGTLMGTTTGVTGLSFSNTTNSVKIGYNSINENFMGAIDELRIWTVARSMSEIQSAMNCTVDQESAGLLAYYTFNNGTANGTNSTSTITDVTGHGYNGAMTGFALSGTVSNFVPDARSNYMALQSSIGGTSNADRLAAAAAADFNGDGYNDILVTDENFNIRLYLNDGKGNFSSYSQITTGFGGQISAGDVDGDGDVDFSVSYGQPNVTVFINSNSGTTFTPITVTMNGSGAATTSKLADLNNDGFLDLIIGNNNFGATDNNEVFMNTGTAGNAVFTFTANLTNTSVGPRSSIAVGDIDNDGDNDILTGGPSWASSLFRNNNDGTFTQLTMPGGYSAHVNFADWDLDGDLDAMIYDVYNNAGLRISKNDGTGNFAALSAPIIQSSSSNRIVLKDLNGDGFLDAVLDNWGGKGKIYLNTGCALVFQTSCEYNLGFSDNGNLVADFNNDGKMDIFNAARNHFSTVYLNYLAPATTPALPDITSAPAVTVCQGASAVLSATASGPETIEWYSAITGGSSLATGPNYTLSLPVGNYTYYVDAVNANGCYTTERTLVNVTVNPLPSVTATSGNVTVCGNATETFTVTSAGTNNYQWYYENSVTPFDSAMITGINGETGFNNDTMTIPMLLTNGWDDYYVYATVTNQFNCSVNSNNILINVNPLPVVGINASSTTVCQGTDITLNGTGAVSYTWTDGVNDNVSFAPASTHTYTVTGTDANGCEDTETVDITVNQLPSVATTTSGITITATETGATYQWLDCNNSNAIISGESSQDFTAAANGSYAVEVTSNGCVDTSACVIITSVGINALAENNEISIYPNPANDFININCKADALVNVSNLLGQNLVEVKTNGSIAKIDISSLSPGVYLISVKSETSTHTSRIVIE